MINHTEFQPSETTLLESPVDRAIVDRDEAEATLRTAISQVYLEHSPVITTDQQGAQRLRLQLPGHRFLDLCRTSRAGEKATVMSLVTSNAAPENDVFDNDGVQHASPDGRIRYENDDELPRDEARMLAAQKWTGVLALVETPPPKVNARKLLKLTFAKLITP